MVNDRQYGIEPGETLDCPTCKRPVAKTVWPSHVRNCEIGHPCDCGVAE